jgi:dual specificity tyrosine-phosphorylation-regulated kinase 2/3/4
MMQQSLALTPMSIRRSQRPGQYGDIQFPPHPPIGPRIPLAVRRDENFGNRISVSPRKPHEDTSRMPNPRFHRANALSQRGSVQINPVILNGPISPQEARAQYFSHLTHLETREIDDFPEIYYLGRIAKKVKPLANGVCNSGYDDTHHHYRAIIGDHIAYRFEIKSILGKGAFGQVLKCFDHKLKSTVALKIIVNTELMQEQGRIECAILQYLAKNDPEEAQHIIKGLDYFIFRKHICVTFEILGPNLYEYSRSTRFRPFSIRQLKPMVKQMLEALAFCHSNRVVHCDMKPENVLLEMGGFQNVKVIDFGSSCFVGQQRYEYIQSRFYRAPEVLVGIKYGPPMDVWSLACIIIELIIGKPAFPGDNEHEQLEMWMEVLGYPPREILAKASRRLDFFTPDGKPLNVKGVKHRIVGSSSLEVLTHTADKLLLDLLKKCLTWDQDKRITAADALNHPWFSVKEVMSARPNNSYLLPGLIR